MLYLRLISLPRSGEMRFRIVAALCVLLPASLAAQRQCKKGIPCGGTCIAANKTCHVGTKSSGAARTPDPGPALSTATSADPPSAASDWVASSVGHTYYKSGCSSAKRLAAKNRMYFKSEGDAKKAGYTRSAAKGC
jgi:hypothetical protein